MQTFEQYGGGYQACSNCNVQTRIGDLVDNRCERCRPKRACISCLIELVSADAICSDNVYSCRDTAACAERVWRTAAKAADMKADQIARSQKPAGDYRHHNFDCEYDVSTHAWSCPFPCAVSDPSLDSGRDWC